ncbi:hypothetical protein B0H16DRAFT_1879249 [Mycena metata]|uniref:F-box domain-containing protein n=1 Tax=Mycena metata TaxID=1033252 RepID=A0AAD7K4R3_9AGAR|nr:hypothetical protein B0H16DRAFT_1879249 [Mycena metata]
MCYERAKPSEGRNMQLPAPILAFPPEILGEIFAHCLPEYPGPTTPKQAPYLLCHVSHHFREIAVSTPRLWSSLCVEYNDFERYVDFCRNGAKAWLSRARSLPLSLILCDDWVRDRSSSHRPEDTLLPAVLGLSDQWRSLDLAGSFWDSLFESGSLSGKVPLLEELSISVPSGAVLLHDAPKLCVLSVSAHSPESQVPWHQLTTFHALHDVDIPSFLEILQNSTNLLQASFALSGDNEPSPLAVSDSRHARLQRLALSSSEWEGVDERAIPMSLLEFLKLPALKDLTINLDPEQSTLVALSPLLSFLSQPGLQLHTLALTFPQVPTRMGDLIKCLEQAPSLVVFRLHCAFISDTDILFTQLTGHIGFLPRLEDLHVVFSIDPSPESDSLTTAVVVQMLSWRWAALGITQLQSFKLLHRELYRSEPVVFLDLLKSESEFQRLEGEGKIEKFDTDLQIWQFRPPTHGLGGFWNLNRRVEWIGQPLPTFPTESPCAWSIFDPQLPFTDPIAVSPYVLPPP